MRNNPVSPALVATAPSACALESELLNSERIVERFGNYGIEVLQHDADIRRTSLYSLEDGLKVCRTFAVVQFHNAATTSVADAHEAILAGNSIGETFKAAGWSINKLTLHVGGLALPADESEIRSLMQLDDAENRNSRTCLPAIPIRIVTRRRLIGSKGSS